VGAGPALVLSFTSSTAFDTACFVSVLDGVSVLDLTRLLPGAYATLLLAELGADVVKVEDPGRGDPLRSLPPLVDDVSVYHRLLNRNKRSLTLDLRQARAGDVLQRLAATADVVVESFRPRTARRLRVTAADLRERHPRLVHCSITGFGLSGPYVDRAGHDINYLGLAGLLTLDPPDPDRRPRTPRFMMADIGGAWVAVAGILGGLFGRERTGQGCTVDTSLHESALAWVSVPAAPVLAGTIDPDIAPIYGDYACYNVYRTADGRYVALGALEPKFWARFCQRVGSPHLIPLQFARAGIREQVLNEVAGIFSTRTQGEWLNMFEDVDACLTPVNLLEDALEDPQVHARTSVEPLEGGRCIRSPIRIETALSPSRPSTVGAPDLGADTDEVLGRAGFSAADIRDFRRARLI
jgi:crotonobetainyl-CoA:carnitine CoA-transferase CaiB-like acyl-CoA transferase